MGPRRQSRELALQLLFQTEFAEGAKVETRVLSDVPAADNTAEIETYARELVNGVLAHRNQIDEMIQTRSANWRLGRMALVDKNILRVAVFEMFYGKPSLSPRIAINEAIELAKRFGSTESRAFVNGLLDEMARGVR